MVRQQQQQQLKQVEICVRTSSLPLSRVCYPLAPGGSMEGYISTS